MSNTHIPTEETICAKIDRQLRAAGVDVDNLASDDFESRLEILRLLQEDDEKFTIAYKDIGFKVPVAYTGNGIDRAREIAKEESRCNPHREYIIAAGEFFKPVKDTEYTALYMYAGGEEYTKVSNG